MAFSSISTGVLTNIVRRSDARLQRVMCSSGIFRFVMLPEGLITLSPSIDSSSITSSRDLSSARDTWNFSEWPANSAMSKKSRLPISSCFVEPVNVCVAYIDMPSTRPSQAHRKFEKHPRNMAGAERLRSARRANESSIVVTEPSRRVTELVT